MQLFSGYSLSLFPLPVSYRKDINKETVLRINGKRKCINGGCCIFASALWQGGLLLFSGEGRGKCRV